MKHNPRTNEQSDEGSFCLNIKVFHSATVCYIKVKMEQLSVMLVKSYVLNDFSDVEELSFVNKKHGICIIN